MVEIVTLFALLATGPHPVEIRVDGRVAAVELVLDGEPAGTLAGPPWRGVVDLGPDLLPHELVAVARDGDGRETGRARRWINRQAGGTASPTADGASATAAGGGEVVFVADPAVAASIRALYEERQRRLMETGFDGFGIAARLQLPLGEGRRAVVLDPTTTEIVPDDWAGYDLFANSAFYTEADGGLSWILSRFGPPEVPERLADAVAVAGWRLAAAGPQAVVLVVAPETADGSLFTPPEVRRYLAALGVPLFVWTPAPDPGPLAERWGEVESVASWELIAGAAARLGATLDAGTGAGR